MDYGAFVDAEEVLKPRSTAPRMIFFRNLGEPSEPRTETYGYWEHIRPADEDRTASFGG
jgi:hypothetical protein